MSGRDEEFSLDIQPLDPFLQQTPAVIEREKAKTANVLALIILVGVIAALPLHLISLFAMSTKTDMVTSAFEKWYALIGPLAGAAVGAYYVSQKSQT